MLAPDDGPLPKLHRMVPDAIPTDAITSTLVDIVIPVEFPAVAPPIVMPFSVTVTATFATSIPLLVLMTMDVGVGASAAPVTPPLMLTTGVALVEKKFNGYVSVMLLPAASDPVAVGVNEKMAVTPILCAMRSVIMNVVLVTRGGPLMAPDCITLDAS